MKISCSAPCFRTCEKLGVCPSLYHTFVPYYLALIAGVSFPWYEKKNAVKVQCSGTCGGRVDVELSYSDDKVTGYVKESFGCLFYNKNATMAVSFFFQDKVCPNAYDVLYPFMLAKKNIKLNCPGCKSGSAEVTLEHT